VAYACLEVCLSLFDKTLGSPLQEEFVSLIEFDACCVSLLVQGEYGLLHGETSYLGYYPFEFGT
jgi:hypothetical protein